MNEISKLNINGTSYNIVDTVTSINGKTGAIGASDINAVLLAAGYDISGSAGYSAGTGISISDLNAISVSYGTTAGTACEGNDSRLSDSRPASDVSSWAKASSKPSYTLDEISDGTNRKMPTKVSDLTNDSGFTTNTGTVTGITVGTTPYSPSSGVITIPAYPSLSGYATESWVNSKVNDLVGIDANGVSALAAVLADSDTTTGLLTLIAGKVDNNDSRLSDARPASDVYSWAKASSKPSYSWSEISSRPTALSLFTNDSGYITSASSCNSAKFLTSPYEGYPDSIITDSTTSDDLKKSYNGTLLVAFHGGTWGNGSFSDTLYWSGYDKFGGTELATEYNAASNVRVKIRKYTQNTRDWGDWTEFITTGNIGSLSVDSASKVTQTIDSSNANYKLLLSGTADNTTRTEGIKKSAYLTYNPSTGNFYAPLLNGKAIENNIVLGDVIDTHAEGSKTIILDGGNDLYAFYDRGGTCTAYEVEKSATLTNATLTPTGTTVEKLSANLFKGKVGYNHNDPYTGSKFAVYDLNIPLYYGYGNVFYWSFGNANWAPAQMRILWGNGSSDYTLIYSTDTKVPVGSVLFNSGDTLVTKIRIVLSSYSRLSSLGLRNYSHVGLGTTYMSRCEDRQVYRDITPALNNTYDLGSSSNYWNDLYVTNINGVAVGSSPKFTDTTYNFSGTSFTSNNSSGQDANNVVYNAHTYYTSNGPSTSLGASTSDGALYTQAYSSSWVGQIAQDYRNGGLYVRGKNNGTWQSWYKVWDSRNLTNLNQLSNGPGYITGITKAMVTNALGYTPLSLTTGGTIDNGTGWASINFRRTSASGTNGGYGTVGGIDGNGLYFFHKTEDETKSIEMYLKAGDGLRIGGNLVYHSGNLPAYPTTLPASDVYSWAKQSTKPSYAYSEIGYTVNATSSAGGTLSLNGTTPLHVITLTGNVSALTLSTNPSAGHSCHVILTSSAERTVAIAHDSTNRVCPGAEDVSLTIPAGGYVEIDFLNANSKIYVRGV